MYCECIMYLVPLWCLGAQFEFQEGFKIKTWACFKTKPAEPRPTLDVGRACLNSFFFFHSKHSHFPLSSTPFLFFLEISSISSLSILFKGFKSNLQKWKEDEWKRYKWKKQFAQTRSNIGETMISQTTVSRPTISWSNGKIDKSNLQKWGEDERKCCKWRKAVCTGRD